MNDGFDAESKVFASQFSWAAQAGDTVPITKILKNANAKNVPAFFTRGVVTNALINLTKKGSVLKR